ncbi:unnamed protein product [Ostreobium quekettii]|uniref:FAD-binding FR-type domain-containing protein n=1 Tax=Ostreobium quekettii TaxID=121088 RepID=A0A8S1JCR1_9CHLO|nr:unnamed protein product [Ostreobium quekettii]
MPEAHREFFAAQRVVYAATVDEAGAPWASALAGPEGFISSPDDRHLRIEPMLPHASDRGNFSPGSPIGLLAIDLATRQRYRANGVILETPKASVHCLLLRIDQSFGNCPKYIASRRVIVRDAGLLEPSARDPAIRGACLGRPQIAAIRAADVFYVASAYTGPVGPDSRENSAGADIAHRGGPVGFVRVVDERTLRWPDYVGNGFFNTLGNIVLEPRCGLLFLDYATGDALQVSGRAAVLFEDRTLPGAQRTVEFRVEEFSHVRAALPLAVKGPVEASPHNPVAVGEGDDRVQLVECVWVKDEATGVKTFEFRMPVGDDGEPLDYLPGQYGSFDLRGPEGRKKVTNRAWTISSHPAHSRATGIFTITVKNIGVASRWLHEMMAPGESIAFRGFGGDFTPMKGVKGGSASQRMAALVAGGIGITPLWSMLRHFEMDGADVLVLYSARTSGEAAFLRGIEEKEEKSGGRIRMRVTVTGEDPKWRGMRGRVDEAFLRRHAPDLRRREVYLCGPQGFMDNVGAAMRRMGCDSGSIFTESFAF